MALLKSMPRKDIVDSFRGVLDFYRWCNLVIARKWPQWKGKVRSPYVQAMWPPFVKVNQAAAALPPHVVDTWKHMARHTQLTWKDYFVRAYIGHTFNPPDRPKTLPFVEIPDRFIVLDFESKPYANGRQLVVTTDVPCYLWAISNDQPPRWHESWRVLRGVRIWGDKWYEYKAQSASGQNEPGNTYTHTFNMNWQDKRWCYGTFLTGDVNNWIMSSLSQVLTRADLECWKIPAWCAGI